MSRSDYKAARNRAWSRYLENRSEYNLEELLRAYDSTIGWIAHDRFSGYTHVEVEDMKQIGMIGALRAIKTLNPKKVKNADAWVTWIAKGRMYHFFNQAQHKIVAFKEHVDPFLEVNMLAMLEEDIDLSMDITMSMLEKLTSRERRVLVLRYWGDWQLKEIAELLGCTPQNVWYIEKQAMKKLT